MVNYPVDTFLYLSWDIKQNMCRLCEVAEDLTKMILQKREKNPSFLVLDMNGSSGIVYYVCSSENSLSNIQANQQGAVSENNER